MDSGQFRHVASLGSSFAAGPGIEPVANRAAMRSARNYPHLLAERLGAKLTDLTVSGATTATILDTPQQTRSHVFPPQVQGLPADADLVTITAGGNDLNYAASMIISGYAGRLSSRALTRPLGKLLARDVPVPSAADLDRAAAGLARVVEAARGKAPEARVLLVDYVTVLGPGTVPGRDVPFDAPTLDALRRLGDQVTEVFSSAAARSGAELVRVSDRSRDHALGSADPWACGLPPRLRDRKTAFHPNAAGMRGITTAILDHLGI